MDAPTPDAELELGKLIDRGVIMQEMLSKAWQLFDSGAIDTAEALYLDCYGQVSVSNHEIYTSVLMGLIYVESSMKKYDEARKYAELLVRIADNDEDRHVAIHQYGMVERMAGNFSKSKILFQQEAELIRAAFSDDDLRISANYYEQAYVEMKMGNLNFAEETMTLALEYAIKAKDSICIGCACRGMGEIVKVRSNSEQAKLWFDKAIDAFGDAGDLIAVEEVRNLARI